MCTRRKLRDAVSKRRAQVSEAWIFVRCRTEVKTSISALTKTQRIQAGEKYSVAPTPNDSLINAANCSNAEPSFSARKTTRVCSRFLVETQSHLTPANSRGDSPGP